MIEISELQTPRVVWNEQRPASVLLAIVYAPGAPDGVNGRRGDIARAYRAGCAESARYYRALYTSIWGLS